MIVDQLTPCYGQAAIFFPDDNDGNGAYARAKQLCALCPIRVQCADTALENREPYGVWGGTTPAERARIIRKAGRKPPPTDRTKLARKLKTNDRAERQRLYDQGATDDEIAAALGTTWQGVDRWRRQNGLTRNGEEPGHEERLAAWAAGLSDEQIAKKVGFGITTIRMWRARHGLDCNRGKVPV